MWDKFEQEPEKDLGLKPTDIDSVSAYLVDVPKEGRPRFVVIVTADKPFSKTRVFGYDLKNPDTRGLFVADRRYHFAPPGQPAPPPTVESYLHFPDAKTAVFVHTDLVQKYLDGYAKNRTAGWPVRITARMDPKAKTSAVAVANSPRACSGDM